jgi:hypothetical protein
MGGFVTRRFAPVQGVAIKSKRFDPFDRSQIKEV